MNFFSTFLRFAEWALEAVLIPRVLVVFVLALTSLTLAAITQKPIERRLWKPYHWLVLTHLLFFPAVIAAGIIWANPITNPTVPHQAIEAGRRCLDVLMYASFASCVWWVWRMRGFRWFAVSLMLLAESLVFCGLFISGMSVAGDWL
jgi:hypothetical protein